MELQEHVPVMLKEIIDFLDVKKGCKYIDATLGDGGYTQAILQRGGEVLGIDQDPKALERAKRRLSVCPEGYQTVPFPGVFKLVNANFSNLLQIASEAGFEKVSGVVFDLGFASFQMDDPKYGLSILKDGPLDMRLDPNLNVTAADLLNTLPEKKLYELFKNIGQEKFSRVVAKAIVDKRKMELFATTAQLRKLVEDIIQNDKKFKYVYQAPKTSIHPATRVFMALRIAVNTELTNLRLALPQAKDLLEKDGKLAIVSFHSGEDAIVKNFIREEVKKNTMKTITKKPLHPREEEIRVNPRSRSAILRLAQVI